MAPWQTDAWIESMRRALRPAQFARMIENRWVTSEGSFIEPSEWDALVDPAHRPIARDPDLAVFAGLDASTKRDSTALVAVSWDPEESRVTLAWHRIFPPPIDFAEVERAVLDLTERFWVREVRYDPFQLAATAQRLEEADVPMIEVPQTTANLTEATTNLYDLVKQGRLAVYQDRDLREQVLRAMVVESARGWRLAKEKASHRIDAAVALSLACLAAVQAEPEDRYFEVAGRTGRGESGVEVHVIDRVTGAVVRGPRPSPLQASLGYDPSNEMQQMIAERNDLVRRRRRE